MRSAYQRKAVVMLLGGAVGIVFGSVAGPILFLSGHNANNSLRSLVIIPVFDAAACIVFGSIAGFIWSVRQSGGPRRKRR